MGNIGTIILAAGESSRLGQPKQLLRFEGKSLVRRVVDAANDAECSPIVVVIGSNALSSGPSEKTGGSPILADRPPAGQTAETAVGPDNQGGLSSDEPDDQAVHRETVRELIGSPAKIVPNQNWAAGIGTSIRAGLRSLINEHRASGHSVTAVVLLVCDQPFVSAQVIEGLIALREKSGKPIAASAYSNTVGVPALFDQSCFNELLSLPDKSGAKPIILRDPERVAIFLFPQGAIDINTITDYQALHERHR
jgi:molybdenum cofactor cytidylyltransferase